MMKNIYFGDKTFLIKNPESSAQGDTLINRLMFGDLHKLGITYAIVDRGSRQHLVIYSPDGQDAFTRGAILNEGLEIQKEFSGKKPLGKNVSLKDFFKMQLMRLLAELN